LRGFANLAGRLCGFVRARWLFRGCDLGALVWTGGRVHVEALGSLRIGDRVQIMGGIVPGELICGEGAELVVGASCIFNYGVAIEATRSVRVGARTQIGSMTRIRDGDGRSVAPVVIGDDVWLAHGVLVEPGVRIGDGAVVSAGSVVVSDIPPRSFASGNPARCVSAELFSRLRRA
jgi:acetyltransferase-like isoleucine patch superfamily enzyme